MEQLLHYVWKHKIFPLMPLQTTSGQPVEVIDPGLPNTDAGPDFFNAKLKINIIRKTKKPFWKNENGKSGREEGKTKTESSPTRTQKKDSV